MTFNPNYAELYGRELERDRLREANRERLIRSVTTANPSGLSKALYILRDRWGDFWGRIFKSSTTYPVSRLPKNSHSL